MGFATTRSKVRRLPLFQRESGIPESVADLNLSPHVVLEFRCIPGAADGTGGIPYPGFKGFILGVRFNHSGILSTNVVIVWVDRFKIKRLSD